MINWSAIRPGDTLTASTPHGGTRRGRVVFRFPTHCVINAGGRHGTPYVVTQSNVLAHRQQKEIKQ